MVLIGSPVLVFHIAREIICAGGSKQFRARSCGLAQQNPFAEPVLLEPSGPTAAMFRPLKDVVVTLITKNQSPCGNRSPSFSSVQNRGETSSLGRRWCRAPRRQFQYAS